MQPRNTHQPRKPRFNNLVYESFNLPPPLSQLFGLTDNIESHLKFSALQESMLSNTCLATLSVEVLTTRTVNFTCAVNRGRRKQLRAQRSWHGSRKTILMQLQMPQRAEITQLWWNSPRERIIMQVNVDQRSEFSNFGWNFPGDAIAKRP